MKCKMTLIALISMVLLSSCSFNPFTTDNKLTGSAGYTAGGAAVGAGTAWALGGSKATIIGSGILGGALGYYVSTLRFASGGVIQSGGQVYTLGDFVTIEIPSDRLFEVNASDFSDEAPPILNSAVAVLERYPNNNILISGNTSGFSNARYEKSISQARAQQVAAYLWAHGINNFQSNGMTLRNLTYVGYGSYFPIANNIRNNSVRQNSRIQITSYPSAQQLEIDKRHEYFNNIGSLHEYPCKKTGCRDHVSEPTSETLKEAPSSRAADYAEAFPDN